MQSGRWIVASVMVASLAVVRPSGAQESAVDGARAASRAAPGDARAAVALGTALRRAGRLAEAAQELRRAAALAPAGETGIAARWELARTAIARREFKPAMAHCRDVAAIRGGTVAGHACAAEAHLLWKRGSEALLETEQALAHGARSYEAKVAEGEAHGLELDDAASEASYREAIAWKADAPEAHLGLGKLLVRIGRAEEGIGELRRARALDPSGPEAAYELASALPAGPEAVSLLEMAVHERPTYAAAYQRLAATELALGHLANARAAAEASVKADGTDTASHLVMGKVALAEGKADDALAEARATLAIVANSAAAKLLMADAWAQKGEIDFALESYQAAYGLDHSDPASLVHASEACRRLGRETSAKAFGEKATREFPELAAGWVALGDALAANKEPAAARAAYDAALKGKGPLDAAAVRAKIAAIK